MQLRHLFKKSRVRVARGCILLKTDGSENGFEYRISLDRCDTISKMLGWCDHLATKRWMTKDVLKDFVLCACRAMGHKVQRGM